MSWVLCFRPPTHIHAQTHTHTQFQMTFSLMIFSVPFYNLQLFEVLDFLGEIFIFSKMGYVLLTFPHRVFKAYFISGAFVSFSATWPSIFTPCRAAFGSHSEMLFCFVVFSTLCHNSYLYNLLLLVWQERFSCFLSCISAAVQWNNFHRSDELWKCQSFMIIISTD